MISDLYREEILEHYKNPQNFGKPTSFTHSSSLANPFCGDSLTLYISIKNNTIIDAAFEGIGCAISVAGASILTEYSKEKSQGDMKIFSEKSMLDLLGIEVSETRKKCALLALFILKDCLQN